MQIYLPIAEMSLNALMLLGLGGMVGFLSGMFGVGGGFLMTPLLIFIGVPPAVAVGTEANQVVAASVSGALAHWRRGNVDIRMGVVLMIGGFIGSTLGVSLFTFLREIGQIDFVIAVSYVLFLGIVGVLMVVESVRAWFRSRNPSAPRRKLHYHTWLHGLPFKMRFRRSKLYISALLPLSIGVFVGILAAIMGVGGGFVMVPAMIYLLGMPTSVVVGTSLFQIVFVTANVTFLQSVNNQTVDIVLAMLLVIGSVIGAQIGARVGSRLRGEEVRIALGLIVLAVCARVAWTLVATPDDLFSLGIGGGTLMLAPMLLLSKRFARWGVIFGVLGVPAPASSQSIVTDLSTREVAISTGFTGAELLLFGATEGFGDIVVTVEGPKRDEIIRRKERVAGIWVNGTSVTFENAPAYYRTAASKPLSEIAAPEVLEKLQIGSSRIDLSTRSSRGAEAILEFREAFIRSKKRQALYSEDISDIKITRGRLFRSTIPFPVSVPIGTYEVTVHLFKDGRLVSSEKTPLTVQKVGLEAKIYDFAHDHAVWYGLIAIAIALVAGWLAGVIFRRA